MIQIFILLYLAIFATGFWLSRRGRPFSVALLTAHKLVSLAAIVLLGFVAYRANGEAALRAIDWMAVALTGLLFIGTIASGGLLSAAERKSAAVRWAHRITPLTTALSTAAALYLLLGPR